MLVHSLCAGGWIGCRVHLVFKDINNLGLSASASFDVIGASDLPCLQFPKSRGLECTGTRHRECSTVGHPTCPGMTMDSRESLPKGLRLVLGKDKSYFTEVHFFIKCLHHVAVVEPEWLGVRTNIVLLASHIFSWLLRRLISCWVPAM